MDHGEIGVKVKHDGRWVDASENAISRLIKNGELQNYEYIISNSAARNIAANRSVLRAINDSGNIYSVVFGEDSNGMSRARKVQERIFDDIELSRRIEVSEKYWFKPGDKVRVVDYGGTLRFKDGDIVTVAVQDQADNVRVLADGEKDTGQGGYYPWRFKLVDSLTSTIASVKAGDLVTVRTKHAVYAEFEVYAATLISLTSKNGEVYIDKSDIIELTITKSALPPEPGVGAIVKFMKPNRVHNAFQIHQAKGWVPIYADGYPSSIPADWETTMQLVVGPEFDIIRKGQNDA